jgi:hypothetical protein
MGKNAESGYVLVVVGSLLFVLVGFTALAVDVGMLLSARTQSQRAADAAALAGAFTFVLSPQGQPAIAEQHAIQAATSNTVLGQTVEAGDVTVSVDVPHQRVTVNIQRTEPTFFAQAFNLTGLGVSVQAVAEAGTSATGDAGVRPWFIPNTLFSSVDACSPGAQVLISGGEVTDFARSTIGSQALIRPTQPTSALSPGEFYSIDLNGKGGSTYRDAIVTGSADQVACRHSYSLKTGNMMGPTNSGTRELIGNPPDTFIAVGQYGWSDGTIRDTSKSLVLSPIADLNAIPGFCPDEKVTGTNVKIQVAGFALLFIESVTKGTGVTARLINVTTCGPTEPAGDDTVGADYAIPVRLIRL